MTPNLPVIHRDRQTYYLTLPLDLALSKCLNAICRNIEERYSFQGCNAHEPQKLQTMIYLAIECALTIILPSRLLDLCCDEFMVNPNELWEDSDSDEWEHPLMVFRDELHEILGPNGDAMALHIYNVTLTTMVTQLKLLIREEVTRYNYHRDAYLIGATVTDDGMGVLLTVIG